ncbi:MAG TPA: hypothetical protein PLZ51_23480, partial [Aggregatilineales bacterium]|nr:hypothetical protein [Aggregatilineales bacterium]
ATATAEFEQAQQAYQQFAPSVNLAVGGTTHTTGGTTITNWGAESMAHALAAASARKDQACGATSEDQYPMP